MPLRPVENVFLMPALSHCIDRQPNVAPETVRTELPLTTNLSFIAIGLSIYTAYQFQGRDHKLRKTSRFQKALVGSFTRQCGSGWPHEWRIQT